MYSAAQRVRKSLGEEAWSAFGHSLAPRAKEALRTKAQFLAEKATQGQLALFIG